MDSAKETKSRKKWGIAQTVMSFLLSVWFGYLVYLQYSEYRACQAAGHSSCDISSTRILYFWLSLAFLAFSVYVSKKHGLFSRCFQGANKLSGNVRLESDAFTYTPSKGAPVQVRWQDVQKITVRTTDQGPFENDVQFIFLQQSGEISIPNSVEGSDQLVTQMTKLPDFDNELFILAMSSTENRDFICWEPQ